MIDSKCCFLDAEGAIGSTGRTSERPDGRCEYEERPGPPPPNHAEKQDPNVRTIDLVRAQESGNENR
jgi:hypothetical protein